MTQHQAMPKDAHHRSHLWWSIAPLVTLVALLVVPVAVLLALGVLDSSAVASIVTVVVVIGLIDWAVAPSIVAWLVPATEFPRDGAGYRTSEPVGAIVARRCHDAGLPLVRLAIVEDGMPNAFTFGRTRRDARVYVTRGLLDRLDEHEVDAVIAHELGHVRHFDFVLMGMAAMVPLALYLIGRTLLESGDDDDDEGGGLLLGLAVLVLWLASELVVLWLSRTRELAADHWSCASTGKGDALASALVKVAYGMTVEQAAGAKALEDAHAARVAEAERAEQARKDGRTEKPAPTKAEQKAAKAEARQQRRRDAAHLNLRSLGICDPGAASGMANGFVGGLDVERAVAAIRWEGRNPWGRMLEKTSTHPLVGRRIAALQASGLPGRPTWLGLDVARLEGDDDVAEARRLRRAFAADVAALLVPWAALVTAVALLWSRPATWSVGLLLAGAGASFAVAQCRRYPFPARGVDEVTTLLHRMDASPVHGIPVEVRGHIVGRDTPGFLFASDLVLQDSSGIVALDYRQPIPFANALFGFTKAKQFVGEDVVVRGWYRRTPDPVIELRELRTADGRRVRPRLWLARFVAAGAIVVAGLAVTTAHLATIGGS